MIHHKREICRCCDGTGLHLILPMGEMPLANAFLRTPDEFATEQFFPLNLYFCENCSLVQLLDVIDPVHLFRNYIYVTGTSETMAAHNREYAATIMSMGVQPADLVVEIASNDGSLLNCFRAHSVRTLGVEPAENISHIALEKGIATVNEFFDSSCAERLAAEHGNARVLIANNVLAHVDDTRDFLRGCTSLIAGDGFLVMEVPYLREFLQNLEYDTIYHEHLCYFSVNSLMRLCDTVGLGIFRIDFVPVHGGSLRVFASKNKSHSDSVTSIAKEEMAIGITDSQTYASFAAAVKRNREALRRTLETFRGKNKRIAAYGAPAKGNTLLNYCDIGPELVSYTVDKSPLKVGLFTPGKHIPVRKVQELMNDQPDYVLLLAWNYAKEVLNDLQEYRNRGGRFVKPIPMPEVIG